MRTILKVFTLLALILLLAGCVNRNNPVDPYEKMNRIFFAFNTDIDHLALRPIAKVYTTVTPPQLQKGVSNVFSNLQELTTFPNDILQGKIRFAFVDFWRFVINTTLGVGGLFDVASRLGLPKHYNDFGLTLSYWEGKNYRSPYVVLPIIGPSTFRAAFGEIPDYLTQPWPWIKNAAVTWTALGLKAIDIRARLLPADQMIKQSLDQYVFVRNAYLQHRNRMIQQNLTQKRPVVPGKQSKEIADHMPMNEDRCDSMTDTCEGAKIAAERELKKESAKKDKISKTKQHS